jgi:sugar transferase EpsL
MKRLLDIVVSILALLWLWPIIAVVAILVRWRMGSPVIFGQVRPGLHGEPFKLYKFRSMTQSRDDKGELLPDADRLTPLGQFLRRFSLDELPQLFNVVKGELSLVGPRPLLMEYLPLYSVEQARRHDVRPGITGWAQINGRNAISWEDKFRLDVWYVDNQSFWLDIKILLTTVKKVLRSDGVSQIGHISMEKFQGSATIVGRNSANRT